MRLNIAEMLTYKRPHGSGAECQFIARYIDSQKGVERDSAGNRWITLGDSPRTLISCHTDTRHEHGGRQKLARNGPLLSLANQDRGDVLGADDGAGVYVALRMIAAGVPAAYVFHRAEECGGLGSDWIANNTPEKLWGFDRAIAFDRRGQTDIITHQMMGRCCSDEFAFALADSLDMDHSPCPFGTFTDTANYTDHIPECTNVAVGYMLEHTHKETLDVDYLEAFVERILRVDFESLPTVRDSLA